MLRRVFGIVFLVAAAALTIAILLRGGSIFPHIAGPVALAIVGLALLVPRPRSR